MSVHSRRATAALQKLAETDPAFGALSLWCLHRDREAPDGSDAIACTDGRAIFYAAGFEGLSRDEQMAVCAHEILHVAFRHVPRAARLKERVGPGFSPRLINIAADALINESLTRAGYALPKPHVELKAVLERVAGFGPDVAFAALDVETLYQKLADAAAAQGEAALLVDLAPDDLIAGRAVAVADALEDVEWSERLDRALGLGAASGRGLGRIREQLGDIPRTRTPWETILRGLVAKAVTPASGATFGAPSGRWLAREAQARVQGRPEPGFEPALRRADGRRPRIAVCVDVSGSITPATLRRFGGEIEGVARRSGAETHLIVFDDGVQLQRKLDEADLRRELAALSFNGRGGTSFVAPIAAARALDPSIILVMTDLMSAFGPAPGRVPVLWVCPEPTPARPPFGRLLTLRA
jgi:predicted metal-dependent peptidase